MSKGTALTFRPGCVAPEVEELDGEVPLGWFQQRVEGYIEVVPGFDCIEHDGKISRCVAFCNEEGKLKGLPFNRLATQHWDKALPTGLRKPNGELADILVGPIVVLFGDDDFMDAL